MPIVDGYVVENAIVSLPYAGQQVSNHRINQIESLIEITNQLSDALRANLNEAQTGMYAFTDPVERMILRYITEHSAYLALDYEKEVEKARGEPDALAKTVSLADFEPTPNMIRYDPTDGSIDLI